MFLVAILQCYACASVFLYCITCYAFLCDMFSVGFISLSFRKALMFAQCFHAFLYWHGTCGLYDMNDARLLGAQCDVAANEQQRHPRDELPGARPSADFVLALQRCLFVA